MYNLVWIVNGREKEMVMQNKPKALCYWKKKQVKHNYTAGSLKVVENK